MDVTCRSLIIVLPLPNAWPKGLPLLPDSIILSVASSRFVRVVKTVMKGRQLVESVGQSFRRAAWYIFV